MGMLPSNRDLYGSTPRANAATPLAPPTPLDPTMQGGGGRTPPLGGTTPTTEDHQRNTKVTDSGGVPTPPALGRTPAQATVTPNTFVDPALIERLRAQARSGFGGTFLTGPRGVLGAQPAPTLLGGG